MARTAVIVCLMLIGALAQTTSVAFGYNDGGDTWTGTCSSGSLQSPIDIDSSDTVDTADTQMIIRSLVGFSGSDFTESWDDGRYTVRRTDGASYGSIVAYPPGSISPVTYKCYTYEFHAPAEHTFDDDEFDMELQMVCRDNSSTSTANYNYAIFAWVQDDGGDASPWIDGIFNSQTVATIADELTDFYSYQGSFTYPDCQQNVNWFVFSEPHELSNAQQELFDAKWEDLSSFAGGRGNNRKTKPVNSRTIYVTGDNYDDFAAIVVAAFAMLFF
jgi:carbonic anhydrase